MAAYDEQATRRTAEVDGLSISYHDVGEGPVLFLIHGSGPGATGWSNFRRNIDVLAQHYRVIAPDLVGFGSSAKPDVPFDRVYSYHSGLLAGLMEGLGIAKASFVGNSLGGGISMKLALDRPDLVDKLVLMGSGGGVSVLSPAPSEGIKCLLDYYDGEGPTREKLRKFLEVMVFDPSQLTDELIEERFLSSTQPEIVARPLFTRSRPPRSERLFHLLGDLKPPVLAIWGRDDRTVTLESGLIMLSQIPDIRFHIFGRCGHWTQWEKADEFNRLVLDFLRN